MKSTQRLESLGNVIVGHVVAVRIGAKIVLVKQKATRTTQRSKIGWVGATKIAYEDQGMQVDPRVIILLMTI